MILFCFEVLPYKFAPKVLEDPNAVFYWKAKEKTPLDSDAPWITMQPVGHNVLTTMVKKMCVLLLSA